MTLPIKVPSMGESISEVTISSQFKPEGAFVKEGEEIGELETDKVNQVIYAPKTGTIHWSVKAGQTISIHADLGTITLGQQQSPNPTQPPQAQTTPEVKLLAKESPLVLEDHHQKNPQREPISSLRQTLSKRLVEAKNTTAMLTTFNEVDMSAVMQLKDRHKESFFKEHGTKLGFMPFFIKASVSALKAFPQVGYQIEGSDFIKPLTLDIGVAVSTDKGLLVPVIRDCGPLKFHELEQQLALLATKAKAKTLGLNELRGGCFSITNGGVFGSLLSTPILNLPQSAILGMHTIQKRAVVVDDQIVIRPMMYLALSYDHRVIDGKEAVGFVVMIKKILETQAEDLFFDRL